MNDRVILSVLFVTLSWRFMGTSAQSNVTVNLNNTGGNNSTNTSGPTVGGGNATVTAIANTLYFLSFLRPIAIPVAPLGTNITGTGCGSTKLCVAQPSACDPSTGNPCYFISAKQQSGQLYNFELSGQSDGYVASSLSTGTDSGGYSQVYICVNNNGVVNFYTGSFNNFTVILNVSNVKGAVSSGKIQCTFGATLPNTTQAAGFSISVATGTYNASSGESGLPYYKIRTAVVDLSNPNATTTNLINNTTTTALSTTVAPTQSQNTAVAPLITTINRTDCGSTKLCAAQPSACDPSTGNQCYFISAKQQSGQLYNFELSGQSDGYIAAGLSTGTDPAGSFQAYICVNNNGVVEFFTGTLNNYLLSLTPLNVINVNGAVSSGKIQCTFGATLPDTKTRAAGYSISAFTGILINGKPGQPSFRIITPVVDLSNPNSTTTNLINNTNSTSGAYPVAHQQSLMMPALLLTMIILVFTTQ